jgi:hypothetical protein
LGVRSQQEGYQWLWPVHRDGRGGQDQESAKGQGRCPQQDDGRCGDCRTSRLDQSREHEQQNHGDKHAAQDNDGDPDIFAQRRYDDSAQHRQSSHTSRVFESRDGPQRGI